MIRRERYENEKTATVLFLLLIVMLAGCSQKSEETVEKTIIKTTGMWRRYNLEEAVEAATTIVHGIVNTKSDTKYYDVETPEGEKISKIYYREVEIQVLDCIKGDPDAETVIYEEEGGETEDTIYICTDIHELQKGEEILIFLNETNKLIAPLALFIVDENQQIQVGSYILPFETVAQEIEAEEKPYYTTEISLEEYCEAIRACLEEPKS